VKLARGACHINSKMLKLLIMTGVWVALFFIVAWVSSIIFALTQIELRGFSYLPFYAAFVLWTQFLCCGMFIIAHDACHGTVAPSHPRLNLWLGRIAAAFYAGFIFDSMVAKHQAHHAGPGLSSDPDFHSEKHGASRFFPWMIRFFGHYMSVVQFLSMCAVAQILMHGFHFKEKNVLIFWVLPSALSAVQLFFFGTYLPHRKVASETFPDRHHARNSSQNFLFSWLSCFHFGAYHHLHHQKPSVPWYALPLQKPEKQL